MPLPQYGNWRDHSDFPPKKNEQVRNPASSNPNHKDYPWNHAEWASHPLDDEDQPEKTFHTLWNSDSKHEGLLHPMAG